jgi:hypothetical protein
MKKIRWLSAGWPLSISDISQKFLLNQYSEDKGKGFLLSSSGSKKISGRYIEKNMDKSLITDPFGNEQEFFTISYYIVQFHINSSSNMLELTDPPRSLRKFISEMHCLLGLGLELSEFNINPFIWLSNIEQKLAPMIVTNISSTGIRIADNGLAKISVSGKKDIRKEFEKIIHDKPHEIESIKFLGIINDCNIVIEINKCGLAKLNGHIYDGLIQEIRSCLESVFTEKNK